MNFVYSLLVACVLAGVEGRLVRRQVPGIPRPVIPPVLPRVNPLGVNPLAINPLGVNPLAVNPLAVNPLNNVPIISYVNENNFDGSYKFSYETGNGISVAEEGFLKNPGGGEEVEAQTSSGSYSYTAPDGQLIQVTWFADENGFHAQTGHGSGRQPGYETGNGIIVQEEGVLTNPGQPELEAQTARGSYAYTSPEGQVISVNWYADETGFHAEGDHIPRIGGQYPALGGVPVVPGVGRSVVPVVGRPVIPPGGLAPVALPGGALPAPQQTFRKK